MTNPVSRGSTSSPHSTVTVRTVEVYFQKCPQLPSSGAAARGIQNLSWRVLSGGRVISTSSAATAADGKITVTIRGGQPSVLQLLVSGNPVASYNIVERTAAAEAVTTTNGRQRRLVSMGYQLGGAAGIDGIAGRNTDRAILEFQNDQLVQVTGVVDAASQTQLTTQAGY